MKREQIIEMAKEAGFHDVELTQVMPSVEHFAALVADAEREECAKVCEEKLRELNAEYYASHAGSEIRARG